MISHLFQWLEQGSRYIRRHPQLLFVLVLILVVPFLFLYVGQQFLEVGRTNQDRLQKDRIGLMHDAFVSIMYASHFSTSTLQAEVDRIASVNPDLLAFNIAELRGESLITLARLDTPTADDNSSYSDYYRSAAVRPSESLIYERDTPDGRTWLAYRAVERTPGQFYFIYTRFSLAAIDQLFSTREHSAYYALGYVYLVMFVLAFWHIKLTDYRYLYEQERQRGKNAELFINMTVHELRSPTTAIRGYASMIHESPLASDVPEFAHQITTAAERMLTIINDLLDVARIQAGKLTMDRFEVDAGTVVTAVVEELKVAAITKHITLTKAGVERTHVILADRTRLQQALTNLVSNAIKYTEAGTIEVAVEESESTVDLIVKDTGAGISFRDQQKLFAPFFRVDGKSTEHVTGTGLGMWVTKQLIELMGGTVAVESIRGVGTHLIVSFPKPFSQDQ